MIMGEFNAPHIDWSSACAHYPQLAFDGCLLSTTLKPLLKQHFNFPTRVREGQQANCLDLILTKSQASLPPLARNDANKQIEKLIEKEKRNFRSTHRLLLLGTMELFCHVFLRCWRKRKVYNSETNADSAHRWVFRCRKEGKNRRHTKKFARRNLRKHRSIVGAMPNLKPPVELRRPENAPIRIYILEEASRPDFDFPPAFFEKCAQIWKDEGVQEAYERSNEYQLIDCAKYFLERTHELGKPDYIPTEQDILRCRVLTSGIFETKFTVDKVQFHMFDVGGQREERRKWIQCFNDVTAIIFVAACSSYNMVLREDPNQNRVRESLELLGSIWNNRSDPLFENPCHILLFACLTQIVDWYFLHILVSGSAARHFSRSIKLWLRNISVILFLNKQDLLTEKVKSGKSKIENYFPNYVDYQPPADGIQTRRYKDTMKDFLKRLCSVTWEELTQDRPVWKRSVKTGAAVYEANCSVVAEAEGAARRSQVTLSNRYTLRTTIPRANLPPWISPNEVTTLQAQPLRLQTPFRQLPRCPLASPPHVSPHQHPRHTTHAYKCPLLLAAEFMNEDPEVVRAKFFFRDEFLNSVVVVAAADGGGGDADDDYDENCCLHWNLPHLCAHSDCRSFIILYSLSLSRSRWKRISSHSAVNLHSLPVYLELIYSFALLNCSVPFSLASTRIYRYIYVCVYTYILPWVYART
ncbi:unnamed protein product [Schistocephalus solidus]|uniref:Adenylate cyclase-stimulating G alpha protein n=1 Tax=Schistocephalus solidus TaxID=70667 RepID=A0A3P7C107_SCHSO|nr:unnamed protein product [Schistocephalus solidus]